jgi:hypothetical protein
MMASALLSGAPPARRGAGHPRPDGKPHAARRDAGTCQPGGQSGHPAERHLRADAATEDSTPQGTFG